jgi:hypothetical protein
LLLVFGIGIAGSAVAQTTTPAPATPAPATTRLRRKSPETKPKSEVKKAKNAMGTVKSASADSLVVTGKEEDAEWTFAVDAKTAIRKSERRSPPPI